MLQEVNQFRWLFLCVIHESRCEAPKQEQEQACQQVLSSRRQIDGVLAAKAMTRQVLCGTLGHTPAKALWIGHLLISWVREPR